MKRTTIVMLMALMVMSIISCQKDIDADEKHNDLGIIYAKKPIWQVENTSDLKQPGGGITYGWIINDDLLNTYAANPATFKSDMALLDGETGQRKWTWNSVLRDFEIVDIDRNTVIPYQSQIFYNYGPRNYCIDLKTGQSIWRKDRQYTAMNVPETSLSISRGGPQIKGSRPRSGDRTGKGLRPLRDRKPRSLPRDGRSDALSIYRLSGALLDRESRVRRAGDFDERGNRRG